MSALFASPRFVAFRFRGSWQAVHEAGHVVTAVVRGCPVFSTRLHERGGCTRVGGDPREMLVIALGGNAAELVFGVGDSDIRCSADDYRKAFLYGIEVAREEERTAPAPVPPSGGRPPVPARSRVARALSAASVAEVESGADRVAARIAARWVARAGVLVDEAEIEVHELLNANRRALGLIAERLEEHRHLDAVAIAVLMRKGRLKQEDARRYA